MKSISRRIKLIIVFFGISSIFVCFIGIIKYKLSIENYYIDNTRLEIKGVPSVLDVRFYPDTQLTYAAYFIRITFNNGGNIYIANNTRRKELKHKPMYIHTVNNYYPRIYNKNEKNIVLNNNLAIWSAIIGVRLETVVDVAKNYNAISEHMERWTDLSEHREKETFSEILERLTTNKLYSDTVTFNGQEYALFKSRSVMYPLDTQR